MHNRILMTALIATCAGSAFAQLDNPDFRFRARLRTADHGQWGSNSAFGNADFRVHSRFMQVYYGGVLRQDERVALLFVEVQVEDGDGGAEHDDAGGQALPGQDEGFVEFVAEGLDALPGRAGGVGGGGGEQAEFFVIFSRDVQHGGFGMCGGVPPRLVSGAAVCAGAWLG